VTVSGVRKNEKGRTNIAIRPLPLTQSTVVKSLFVLRFSFFLTCGAVLCAQAPPDAWSQFRGDARLSGIASSKLPPTPKLLWTYEAGESVESSAAIADGLVFVGSQPSDLVALDLATGKLRWKYAVKLGIGESSPAVAGGVVYVGDLSGIVHAVGAMDGKPRWTFTTQAEIKSSPVVADGKILIGSYDGHLYALRADTGALLWKTQTQGPVHATAALVDGLAYVTGCDEFLHAIRVSDGREMFTVASRAYTGASPVISGNAAYYGTFENEVLKVDLQARTVVWRYAHPERHFPFYSSAAIADGKVILGGRDKIVHALDTTTGKSIWTFIARARVDSSPVIVGDRVYIGSNDGRVYALAVKDGAKVWEFTAGAPLSASPAVAAGKLVIGAQDGRIYCFG